LIRRGETPSFPAEFSGMSSEVRAEVLYRIRYQGYLSRELRHVQKVKQLEEMRIPGGIDYRALRGLRRESVGKLVQVQPLTLGQASRISGVSPADISILMVSIEAGRGHRTPLNNE
jgi:tRNA uridine 5-carboxymethylaminomethyl modification enzyme